MKYIVILGDGMADEPIDMLGGLTPLQYASTPNMDRLAAMGRNGLLDTIPAGYPPGSEIANLAVLGYDVPSVFEGRGSLEAASMGVNIEKGEMALRCNLITLTDGKIENHSAGHIGNEEAAELIAYLQQHLGGEENGRDGFESSFFPGVSYRHLIKIKNGNKALKCTPPHDVLGTPYEQVLAVETEQEAQRTAEYINWLTERSQELLANHPINNKRRQEGKAVANSIWLWSPGYKPAMKTFREKYGLEKGAVISAVDLIKGIGIYAGLESIDVEGATGLHDTNYEGKTQAALDALKGGDFVFLHIEASDEAGHEGDVMLKVKTVEDLDKRVLGPIMQEIEQWQDEVAVAVLPDHPTPCSIRTHTAEPIPFVIYKPGMVPDKVEKYDEHSAKEGSYGILEGPAFMDELLKLK